MPAPVAARLPVPCRLLLAGLLAALAACGPLPRVSLRTDGAGGTVHIVRLVERPGRIDPQRITLHPGRYVFQVENHGVAHPVSFYLARIDDADGSVGAHMPGAALPRPIRDGEVASTGPVNLRPGRYTYRCPLNPTPHYFIRVD